MVRNGKKKLKLVLCENKIKASFSIAVTDFSLKYLPLR